LKRALLQAGVVLALGMATGHAEAQTKKECADAYVAGQVSRKDGHLRDARAKFEVCAATSCPAALQRDCKPWKAQLDKDIPTLAVKATDDAGAAMADAAVTVDGAPLPAEGWVAVDPGEHVVHVEGPGMAPAEQRVTVASGDGQRTVAVRLVHKAATGGAAAAAASSKGRPVPVGPIVVGAAGVVALAVFGGLGAVGNSKKAALDASGCKPNCSQSDVDAARSMYLGADIALGVGLAAIVAAGVWLGVALGAPAPPADVVSFSPSPGGGGLVFHF